MMTTIEAKIPEPVLKQARELAERENIHSTRSLALRATKEKFIEALKEVPGAESPEDDRLPEGYQPESLR